MPTRAEHARIPNQALRFCLSLAKKPSAWCRKPGERLSAGVLQGRRTRALKRRQRGGGSSLRPFTNAIRYLQSTLD